jgi:hypothetical protein
LNAQGASSLPHSTKESKALVSTWDYTEISSSQIRKELDATRKGDAETLCSPCAPCFGGSVILTSIPRNKGRNHFLRRESGFLRRLPENVFFRKSFHVSQKEPEIDFREMESSRKCFPENGK